MHGSTAADTVHGGTARGERGDECERAGLRGRVSRVVGPHLLRGKLLLEHWRRLQRARCAFHLLAALCTHDGSAAHRVASQVSKRADRARCRAGGAQTPRPAVCSTEAWQTAVVTGTEHTVLHMRPSTLYVVRVAAVNGRGLAHPSLPVSLRTSDPDDGPTPCVTADSATSLNVSWPSPVAAFVHVDCCEVAPEAVWRRVYSGTTASCAVRSLRPATCYAVRVRFVEEGVAGLWGTHGVAETDSPASDDAPMPVCISRCCHTLQLAWGDVRGDQASGERQYRCESIALCAEAVQCIPAKALWARQQGLLFRVWHMTRQQQAALCRLEMAAEGEAMEPVAEGPATTFTAEGLKAGQRYSFRLHSSQDAPSTAPCVVTFATAAAPPECPSEVRCTVPPVARAAGKRRSRCTACISVHWHGATGSAAAVWYHVQALTAGGTRLEETVKAPHAQLRRAAFDTTYTVRVRALSPAGASPWSETAHVCTPAPPPVAPRLAAVEATAGMPVAKLRQSCDSARSTTPRIPAVLSSVARAPVRSRDAAHSPSPVERAVGAAQVQRWPAQAAADSEPTHRLPKVAHVLRRRRARQLALRHWHTAIAISALSCVFFAALALWLQERLSVWHASAAL